MRGQEIGLMMAMLNRRFPQQEAPHGARELSVNLSSLYWSTFLFYFFSANVFLAINFNSTILLLHALSFSLSSKRRTLTPTGTTWKSDAWDKDGWEDDGHPKTNHLPSNLEKQ